MVLKEKRKNDIDITTFPVLSKFFFAWLPSCSLLAPHATTVNKTKAMQPKSAKIPITQSAEGKQQIVWAPQQRENTSKSMQTNMKRKLQHTWEEENPWLGILIGSNATNSVDDK